jgi:hypothetical protein
MGVMASNGQLVAPVAVGHRSSPKRFLNFFPTSSESRRKLFMVAAIKFTYAATRLEHSTTRFLYSSPKCHIVSLRRLRNSLNYLQDKLTSVNVSMKKFSCLWRNLSSRSSRAFNRTNINRNCLNGIPLQVDWREILEIVTSNDFPPTNARAPHCLHSHYGHINLLLLSTFPASSRSGCNKL